MTLLLEVQVSACEELPRGRHPDSNNFKYGHELSLLSAVRIKGCLNQEKFRFNKDQSRGCVSQWERSAVTNILSYSCGNQIMQQIFFLTSQEESFHSFTQKRNYVHLGLSSGET